MSWYHTSKHKTPQAFTPQQLVILNCLWYQLLVLIGLNEDDLHVRTAVDYSEKYICFIELCIGQMRHIQIVQCHYIDDIMTTLASQITSLTVVYSIVYSDADQRKHQSSASLAFVWGIHRDRWIPRTKGQLRGKCFHLMTSSFRWRRSDYNTQEIAVQWYSRWKLIKKAFRKRNNYKSLAQCGVD